MTIKHHLPALCAAALAIVLAGCGEKAGDTKAGTQASGSTVNAQASTAGIKPRAGQWQVQLQMTNLDVPGLPAELKDTVGKQIQQAGNALTCLTQAEVDRNDGKFFGPRDQDCSYSNMAMADGRISADLSCTKSGMKQSVKMRGTYGAEAYDLTLDTLSDMAGKPVKMTMQVTGKRTGECTGKEKT